MLRWNTDCISKDNCWERRTKELYTSNSATSSLGICWGSEFASSVPNELSHAVLVPANCCMWKDAKAAQKVLSIKWTWKIYSYQQKNKQINPNFLSS